MARFSETLSDKIIEFISKQKIFFVGTAASDGRVNVSPKGMDTLKVISPTKVIWLNFTGSRNETAAHVLDNNRMTIMFCSFDEKPLILRLYGKATAYHERDTQFHQLINHFPKISGSRQIFEMEIESTQQSCGFALPFMEFKRERTQLVEWSDKLGEEKITDYQKKNNQISIDGLETKLFDSLVCPF